MKFHCDSVKLTVKKAVGGGIECAAAHSWQNKSFLKKKPSLTRTKVKKSCRGRGRMRRGAQLAKQKFFKKKPSLTRTKVKKSCRGRGRTSTRQLASTQSLVVNPGRPDGRLYAVFIPYSSPSRQEGMSAKNFITPQY